MTENLIKLAEHFKFLGSLAGLLAGIWTISYIRNCSRSHPALGLKYLFYHALIFNGSLLVMLLTKYNELNLPEDLIGKFLPARQEIGMLLSSFMLLGLSLSIMWTVAWLWQNKVSRWLSYGLSLGLAVFLALALIGRQFPEKSVMSLISALGLIAFLGFILLVETVFLLGFPLHRRKQSDPDRRRMASAFSWFYFSRYLALLLLFPLFFVRHIPSLYITSIGLTRLLLVYVNLIPVFWIKYFFVPWFASLDKLLERTTPLAVLLAPQGLSPRELEVIHLILDGKSNKEIENILFVSIHTVKNHIYNIFRKLGVKSRHQLLHLVALKQKESGRH